MLKSTRVSGIVGVHIDVDVQLNPMMHLITGTLRSAPPWGIACPYMPTEFGTLWSEMTENGWKIFAHPLNFRIGRHCQPYHMDVI